LYDIDNKRSVQQFLAPSVANSILPIGQTFIGGMADRSLRVFDSRVANALVKTFIGHKSSVQSVKKFNNNQIISCDLSGICLLWDLRAQVPYHKVDFY
jgi:WD40 repeat protein